MVLDLYFAVNVTINRLAKLKTILCANGSNGCFSFKFRWPTSLSKAVSSGTILSGAGRSSLLYRLKTNNFVQTIPTIGFNVELIHLKYCVVMMWDIGGGEKIRPLWRHYYEGTNGLVFMIDSSDKENLREAAYEFHSLLSMPTNTQPVVLILANKQDLHNCLNEDEIIEIFELRNKTRYVTWHIQSTSVKEGYGVDEGMEWLSKALCK